VLYANVDGFAFREDYIPVSQRPEIDPMGAFFSEYIDKESERGNGRLRTDHCRQADRRISG
jgi:hypothetical protein